MACKKRVLLMALLAAAGWPAAVRAQMERDVGEWAAMQGGGRPALSATGTATVQQKPTRMRMYIQLFGKAKTLEEALAKLKERREAAVLQLESLKADKQSVVFDGPTVSSAQAAQKRQIEAMVMEQMRARGKKPKGLQVPQTVTVTGSLTAEWPLEAKSQEQLLLLAQGIEEKIKAADLSGSQEVQKLSPEEEELAEEAKQAMGRYGEQPQPLGQPTFLFVAVLSKQDRQKAMAEAFTKAAAEAADLAKAAGVGLGPLIGPERRLHRPTQSRRRGIQPLRRPQHVRGGAADGGAAGRRRRREADRSPQQQPRPAELQLLRDGDVRPGEVAVRPRRGGSTCRMSGQSVARWGPASPRLPPRERTPLRRWADGLVPREAGIRRGGFDRPSGTRPRRLPSLRCGSGRG